MLDSGSDTSIVGEADLCRFQEQFRKLQLVRRRHGHILLPAGRPADGNHFGAVGARCDAVDCAILSGGDDVRIFRQAARGIAGHRRLARAQGESEAVGVVSSLRLTMSLAEVKRMDDCVEEPGLQGDSLTGALLAGGPAMVLESDQEHLFRLEVLECALD